MSLDSSVFASFTPSYMAYFSAEKILVIIGSLCWIIVSSFITANPTPCSDLDALVYIFVWLENECWIVLSKREVIIVVISTVAIHCGVQTILTIGAK